eukprot:COSAG04_NODE_32458_length_251_cov_0.644737_2_plen_29_part_01
MDEQTERLKLIREQRQAEMEAEKATAQVA